MNKLENRMINIKIQQNTLIIIGKDSKYVRGTTGKIVEQIIFRKYPERTIKKEDIEKRSLDEKKVIRTIFGVREKKKNKRRKTGNRKQTCKRTSQISESEIEDILIEIKRMKLNETKDVM